MPGGGVASPSRVPRNGANSKETAESNVTVRGKSDRNITDPPWRTRRPPTQSSVGAVCKITTQEDVDGKGLAPDVSSSPDLTSHRAPRPPPANNPDGVSDLPTLPSIPSNYDDFGPETDATPGKNANRDVRNDIGPEHNIRSDGLVWLKYNWNAGDGQDDDTIFRKKSYFEKYIESWRDQVNCDVHAKYLKDGISEHWECDVNTYTGFLVSSVDYPQTFPSEMGNSKERDWNDQNWSSSLLIHRKAALHAKLASGRGDARLPADHDDAGDYKAAEEVVPDEVGDDEAAKEVVLDEVPYSACAPRVPCCLRPTTPNDMEEVMAIYNWEVQNGTQMFDSHFLTAETFTKIYDFMRKSDMPFLVAVYGSVKTLQLKEGKGFFARCSPHPDARVPPNPDLVGKILGFAYLMVWQPGLLGGCGGTSRATVEIRLYVHPQYRRKNIGDSLMDRLLMTFSTRFYTSASYDFIDPTNSRLYREPPERQTRQYFHLYYYYFVRHKTKGIEDPKVKAEQDKYDDGLESVRGLLEGRFGFHEKTRFDMVFRSPRGRPGPVFWLDAVVFEHTCHIGDIPQAVTY